MEAGPADTATDDPFRTHVLIHVLATGGYGNEHDHERDVQGEVTHYDSLAWGALRHVRQHWSKVGSERPCGHSPGQETA